MKNYDFFLLFFFICLLVMPPFIESQETGTAYQRGVNFYVAGKYEVAIKEFLQALTENSDNFDSYYYLGMSYVAVKKPDDAYFTFKRSLDIRTKRENLIPEVYAAMMRIQIEKFNYSAAEKLGLYALKNGYKTVNLFFELARAYLFKKDFIKSQKAIDLALELDPVNPYTYNLQALLFLSRNMGNSAITAAQTAIAFKNDVHYFYANLGAAHEQLGQYDKATVAYQNAIKYNPQNQAYVQALKRNKWLETQ